MGTGVWYPWIMIRCCRALFPLYLYLLILSRICCKGDVCLPYPIPMYVYFNETSASGSVIFVSNETNSVRKEWSLSSYEPRVALTFVKGTYQLVLLSAVDLDVANPDDICSPPEQFVQRITCYRNGQDPIIHWVTFQARPVNDNPPEADTLPDIQISEGNVSLPLFLYPLLDYFKDRDCPKERLVLSISKYSSEKATGSNGQTGNFTLQMSVEGTPSTISKLAPTTTTTMTSNTLITKLQEMTSSPTKIKQAPSNKTSDSTIKQPHSSKTTSDSTKDTIIIVLAVVVGLLISAFIVQAVYRIRIQKTKAEDKVTSYEEVKRNSNAKENEYATIQN